MATIRTVEILGKHLVTGEDRWFRFATHGGYMSKVGDDPPLHWFDDRLTTSLNFERTLADSRDLFGPMRIGQGEMRLGNPEGELDILDDYSFDGRTVLIREGDDAAALSTFQTIFRGVAEAQEISSVDEITIRLRDRLADLDKPIQPNLYAGTNSGPDGTEGGEDLKDKPKPLVWGERRNVPAKLVNSSLLIYQVHDGPVEDITAAWDRGSAWVKDADCADLAALKDATVAGGHFATCHALGMLKPGMKPSGQVTCSVRGDKTGGAYVETLAPILRRILTVWAGAAAEDIAESAFNTLDLACPSVTGLYLDQETTILEAINRLLPGGKAWLGADTLGRYTCGQLRLPTGPSVATIDNVARDPRLERQVAKHTENGMPAWRVSIRYSPNDCPLDRSALKDTVAADQIDYFCEEWRTATAEDAAIKTLYPHAQEVTLETCLRDKADAEALASAVLAMLSSRRDFWLVPVPSEQLAGVDLASDVTLVHKRFGLSAGRLFTSTGIVRNYGLDRHQLILWGG